MLQTGSDLFDIVHLDSRLSISDGRNDILAVSYDHGEIQIYGTLLNVTVL